MLLRNQVLNHKILLLNILLQQTNMNHLHSCFSFSSLFIFKSSIISLCRSQPSKLHQNLHHLLQDQIPHHLHLLRTLHYIDHPHLLQHYSIIRNHHFRSRYLLLPPTLPNRHLHHLLPHLRHRSPHQLIQLQLPKGIFEILLDQD